MRPAAAAPARPAPTPALAPARQPCPLTPRPGPLRPWGQRAEVRGRGEEPLLLPPPGAQARGAAGKGLGTGGTRSLGQARPAAACPELRKLVVPLSGSSPTGAPAADQLNADGNQGYLGKYTSMRPLNNASQWSLQPAVMGEEDPHEVPLVMLEVPPRSRKRSRHNRKKWKCLLTPSHFLQLPEETPFNEGRRKPGNV
ncbi:uncharacterized protein LOC114673506 isoform X3 [Macaca mulatta]